jgi:tetratricopeptide (TPR) repeat protein
LCGLLVLTVIGGPTVGCSKKKKKKTTPKAGAREGQKDEGSMPTGSTGPEARKDARKGARPTARAGGGTDGAKSGDGGAAAGTDGGDSGAAPAARGGGTSARPSGGKTPRAAPRQPREDPAVVKQRHMKKANQALRNGKNDQAIAEAKSVLAVDEKNAQAMVIIAKAYFRKNKLELCRATLSFLAKVDPNNGYGFYLAGQLALKDGEGRKARGFFEKAVEKAPNLPEAWRMLCVWNVQGKNWKESDPAKAGKDGLTACKKAVKLQSWNYKSRLNLGNVYRGLGADCRPLGISKCQAQKVRCTGQGTAAASCETAFQNCRKRVISSCKSTEALYYKKAKDAYMRANELYQKYMRKRGKSASPYPKALHNLGILYLDAIHFPGESGLSRLKKAKAYLKHYLRALDPRQVRKEQKRVKALLQRADNLLQVEKAKEQARKAREMQNKARPRGGGG